MNLYAKVYSPTDLTSPLGAGPVRLTSARFSRELDRVGSFAARTAFGYARAHDLFTQKNRVEIYGQLVNGTERILGMGIIEEADKDEATGSFDIKGDDILKELVDANVWTNKKYLATSIADVVDDLVTGVSGWATSITGATTLIDIRFDGTSVFKAVEILAKRYGLHLRLGTGRVLEFGAFGDSLDLRAVKPAWNATNIAELDGLCIIEQPKFRVQSGNLVNRIQVLGGGEGKAAVDLEFSTRVSPYTIKTTTDSDGEDIYYIEEEDSVTEYGAIEKLFKQREVIPISHNSSAREVAANAAFDAAAAYLARNAWPIEIYNFVLRGVNETLKPGMKPWMDYRGYAYDENKQKQTVIDLDGEYWAVNVTENYDGNGLKTQTELSNVDQQILNDEQVILQTFESVALNEVYIKPFPSSERFGAYDTIQSATSYFGKSFSKDAYFYIEIDETVQKLVACIIRFKTFPLNGTVFTFDSPPAFSVYGVHDGGNYPRDIHLYVNGVDISASVGGPWQSAGGANAAEDQEIDITDYILSAGLWGDHEIKFVSATGRVANAAVFTGANTFTGNTSHGVVHLTARLLTVTQALGV
jgi:hypothetical protein